MLEVRFTITESDVPPYLADWAAFARQTNRKRSTVSKRWALVYYVLLIGVPCLLFLIADESSANGDALLIALASGVAWRFILDKLWKVLSSKRTQSTPQFLGEHHIQVLPEGLCDTTSYWRWTIFWPGVNDIVLMQNNLLFVTERGGAFPVPRKAFAEEDAYQCFYENSLTVWKQSSWPPARRSGDSQELGENTKC